MPKSERKRLVVSGSTGFIGSRFVSEARAAGYAVSRLLRPESGDVPGEEDALWNPAEGSLDPEVLEGAEAVVSLSGYNVAASRWTSRTRRLILESRIKAARTLVETIARLKLRPRMLLVASGIGYYGSPGDAAVDEYSGRGEGFLASVASALEAEAARAEELGVKVVIARLGMVVGPGGALAMMVSGLGGKVALAPGGKQWWSWMDIQDVVGGMLFLLSSEEAAGVYNLVAPAPVRAYEFMKVVARALGIPGPFKLPAVVTKLVLGKMGEELILASVRAKPRRLMEMGFGFTRPALEDSVRASLKSLGFDVAES